MSLLQNSNAIPQLGGYNLTDSVRFRGSQYLSRTPSSTGSQTTFTLSAWIKRCNLGSSGIILSQNTSNSALLSINNTDELAWDFSISSGRIIQRTNAKLRDPSAWYHIVWAIDTTQSTDTNRFKMYINSELQSTYVALNTTGGGNYFTQNQALGINTTNQHDIGRRGGVDNDAYFDGYMTAVNFIDGQQLTPSDFGETDSITGVWKPKEYTGTYGTNGFYLDMSTSGSTVTDQSGNSNNWTATNMNLTTSTATTYDKMSDVPTLTDEDTANFCTLSPLNRTSGMDISEGNLKCTTTSGAGSMTSTMATGSSGKYYAEFKITSAADSTLLGIVPATYSFANGNFWNYTDGVAYYYTGVKIVSGSSSAYGASYTTNDVIGVAIDMDAGEVTFYKNGVSQGVAHSGLSGNFYFAVGDGSSGSNTGYWANFGQRPFAYTPPTGYKKLNTYNLPDSAIKDGSQYFDVDAWSGTTSAQYDTQSRSSLSFSPDLVWIKSRSDAVDHTLVDSVTGAGKYLSSNTTTAQTTDATGYASVYSFDTNGWTMEYNGRTSMTGRTYVGWAWKGSDSTAVSNTDGSITSTVSANTTSGFSVVTYTGSGSNSTVGHGLGVAPKMIILKCRSFAYGWNVYHESLGNTKYLNLNTTGAAGTAADAWNSTSPTTSVFHLGTNLGLNQSGQTFVAYCFAEVEGFSKFGSYIGNGSADGTFVYTGFRPAFVLIKNITASTQQWYLFDTTRDPYNVAIHRLFPSISNAEATDQTILDFLSNGIKFRTNNINSNASGNTYIYMAFASNPLKHSLAR